MTLSRRTVVIAGVCAAFATGLAIGAVPNAAYVGGDPLSATALQGDFEEIEARLNALEAPSEAFCGITEATFTGDLGGYAGAQTHCASVCGGNATPDPNAHMCTSEEMAGHAVRGGVFPPHPDGVWYATGLHVKIADDQRDCIGFTSAASTNHGSIFYTNAQYYPGGSACSESFPIACCR